MEEVCGFGGVRRDGIRVRNGTWVCAANHVVASYVVLAVSGGDPGVRSQRPSCPDPPHWKESRMTKPTDKDAIIKRQQQTIDLLKRRIDKLLEENESLMLELQARVSQHTEEARRKSWGGNGRY